MTHNYFTHEQAMQAVASFRSIVPEQVEVNVNDVGKGEEYSYSYIAFSIDNPLYGYHCVATADSGDALKCVVEFINLMCNFSYPPQEMEIEHA